MIGASHPFQRRSLNALDENGNEGCAFCGRPRSVHPDDKADGSNLKLLADLILGQETGIADGSLIAAGGYVWPNPRAGTVPSSEETRP